MFSRVLCLFFLLVCSSLQAHQADVSSTVLAEQGENQWILQIRGALTGFEYVIHSKFGKDSYTTPEGFQELVLKHVKENISIQFDDKNEVELKNGIVKLGHETNVIFEVGGIPENFTNVKFKNSSFKDIARNQSALIILKKGFKQKQFVLNNKNQHTANLEVKDSQLVLLNPETATASVSAIPNLYIGIAVLGIAGILLLLFFRKKENTPHT